MSVLDEAYKQARHLKEEKEQELEKERTYREGLRQDLAQLTDTLLQELKTLHNQKAGRYGLFCVEEISSSIWDVFAYLKIQSAENSSVYHVGWFKAKIVSGTFDGSDDCRNIPYTEPCVWARIWKAGYQGAWDVQERDSSCNHPQWSSLAFSAPSEFGKFKKELTMALAPWLL